MRQFPAAAIATAIIVLTLPAAPREPAAARESSSPAPGAPQKSVPPIRAVATITSAADVGAPVSAGSKHLRLLKPHGLAVDESGRIFVADPSQGAVLLYDRTARVSTRWTGSAQHPLAGPASLAFGSGGRLFVSDAYRGQVVVFDPGGAAVTSFGRNHLKRPGAVAVDRARGRVYVADVLLRRVLSFDERTFALDRTYGGSADAASQLAAPAALAVNSNGNLYVADRVQCRVQVYRPDGRSAGGFGTLCLAPGEFARASSIAIDPEDHVYVADAELGTLQVFTADGKDVLFAGSLGRGRDLSVLRTGLAVGRDGRVYVAEQRPDGGSVQILEKIPERSARARAAAQTQAQR